MIDISGEGDSDIVTCWGNVAQNYDITQQQLNSESKNYINSPRCARMGEGDVHLRERLLAKLWLKHFHRAP